MGGPARQVQRPHLPERRGHAAAFLPDAVHPVLRPARWRGLVRAHCGAAATGCQQSRCAVRAPRQGAACRGLRLRPHGTGAGHAGDHRLRDRGAVRSHRVRRAGCRVRAAALRRRGAGVGTRRAVPVRGGQGGPGHLPAGMGRRGLHRRQLHSPGDHLALHAGAHAAGVPGRHRWRSPASGPSASSSGRWCWCWPPSCCASSRERSCARTDYICEARRAHLPWSTDVEPAPPGPARCRRRCTEPCGLPEESRRSPARRGVEAGREPAAAAHPLQRGGHRCRAECLPEPQRQCQYQVAGGEPHPG